MIGIILAAGQGTRLRPLTDDRPKCLVEMGGTPLLDLQTAALRAAGVLEIIVVGGYRAEKIRERGYEVVVNPDFERTNMVATLFSAWNRVDPERDLIVSYGDIVCEPRVVRALRENGDPLGVVVDREWRRYWEIRMEDPLRDAETMKLDGDGRIRELGKKPSGYEDIQGQYTGLFKIRADHLDRVRSEYDGLDRGARYDGKDFPNMYMTSFLQHLIDAGIPVRSVPIENGWLETDTTEDLALYHRMAGEGTLAKYYDRAGLPSPPREKKGAFSLEMFLARGLASDDASRTLDRLFGRIDAQGHPRAFYAPDLSHPEGQEELGAEYLPLLVRALIDFGARHRMPKLLDSAMKRVDRLPPPTTPRERASLKEDADRALKGLSHPS